MKKWLLILGGCFLASCASTPETASTPAATERPQETAAMVPEKVKKEVFFEVPVVSKVTSYYADGLSAGSVVSTYDTDGYLTREDSLNPNGALLEYKTGQRNAMINRISSFSALGDLQSVKEVQFSDDGRVLKETLFNARNQIQSVNEYAYSSEGLLMLWLTKGGADNLLAKTEYLYENGRNNKIVLWDEKGTMVKSFETTFDFDGRATQKKELESDGKISSVTVYSYSGGALVKEEVQNDKGTVQRSIEYEVNEKGLPVKAVYYDRRGKVIDTKRMEYSVIKKSKWVTE